VVFTLLVCGHTSNELKWLKELTFQTFVTNWLTLSIQSFRQAVWYGFFVQWKKLYNRLIDGAATADRMDQCLFNLDLDLDFGRWSIDRSRSAKTDRSIKINLDQQSIAASVLFSPFSYIWLIGRLIKDWKFQKYFKPFSVDFRLHPPDHLAGSFNIATLHPTSPYPFST